MAEDCSVFFSVEAGVGCVLLFFAQFAGDQYNGEPAGYKASFNDISYVFLIWILVTLYGDESANIIHVSG